MYAHPKKKKKKLDYQCGFNWVLSETKVSIKSMRLILMLDKCSNVQKIPELKMKKQQHENT